MATRLLGILLIIILVNTSCAKQACDGPGPCNYPKYVDIPLISGNDKFCRYSVVKRIDCGFWGYSLDCDEPLCVKCDEVCPVDSTDAAGNKFLKIKYKSDDYVLKLGAPYCGICTTPGMKKIYKAP